jgi:hypothetical protein
MKYYLILLLLMIMGAGARTMFEIAHQGLTQEHGLTPDGETQKLIYLALWFVAMMMVDVVLLRNKELKSRNLFVALLSIGVFAPVVFKLLC